MKIRKLFPALALACTLAASSHVAHAGVVYQVVDTIDNPGDPNRMKYIYHLDAATPANYGLTFYFDASSFADIEAVTPSGSDWFATVSQPDPGASLAGLSSFLALSNIPAGMDQFEVNFTWLGTGTPGAQAYEQFDDQFSIIASGRTALTSEVPEPSTALLFIAGAVLLARRSARYHRTS